VIQHHRVRDIIDSASSRPAQASEKVTVHIFDDDLRLLRNPSIEVLPNMPPICGALQAMIRSDRILKVTLAMAIETNTSAVVHVIDDDASIAAALQSLLETVGLVTRTYRTARDFLNVNLPDNPGCVIIDVRLPDINGLEFQAKLAQLGVRLPVIVITGHADIPMSVRAMKGGAVDFLSKPFRDQDMIDAVLTAIERDRERRVVDHDITQLRQRLDTLSRREQQVMLLATAGRLNKQIAAELGISEVTVKVHRGAAMRKMQALTFADLVRMVEVIKSKP
jgi:FixJ family two-component response regulator